MSATRAVDEKTAVLACGGAGVEFVAEYQPDEAVAARVLMMILGLPTEELERVLAEMELDSQSEM